MNTGQKDQLIEAIKDMAFVMKEHYDKLISVGFGHEQALQLTIAFQRDMLGK